MNIEDKKSIRLNKLLSQAGVCSRREADSYIESGRVSINGEQAVVGQRAIIGDKIRVDGRLIAAESLERELKILAFNKPKGLVSTTAKIDKRNIIDYLRLPYRVFPIGRLDKDSHGLMLLTDNGDIVNKILKSANNHEKEYLVTLDRKYSNDFLFRLQKGVHIFDEEKNIDTVTKPCKCIRVNSESFKIILTQGLNRQIRRMCDSLGHRVLDLKRLRIMSIELGSLATGEYRMLDKSEIDSILQLLGNSHN